MFKICYGALLAEPINPNMTDEDIEEMIKENIEYLEGERFKPVKGAGTVYDYAYSHMKSSAYEDVLYSAVLYYGSWFNYLSFKRILRKHPFSKVFRVKPGRRARYIDDGVEKELVQRMVKFGVLREKKGEDT